jgi:hypothetical protein
MTVLRNRAERREAAQYLAKTNAQYPGHLVQVPESEWHETAPPGLLEVWRSRDYLVQVYREQEPCAFRLSINRTAINSTGWVADIPWEDLQRLKTECGLGMFDAIEIYPNKRDVINVANIRHLFVMADPLSFAWRKS